MNDLRQSNKTTNRDVVEDKNMCGLICLFPRLLMSRPHDIDSCASAITLELLGQAKMCGVDVGRRELINIPASVPKRPG